MTATYSVVRSPSRALSAPKTILLAGFLAAFLDISTQTVLFALRHRSPIYLFQVIAGGILGESTFDTGVLGAALGAFCHFLIAVTAAAVFFAASRMLKPLVRHPIAFGLLYGIVVYVFMRFIVLPLSAYHYSIVLPPMAVLSRDLLIHMVMVGLPISLVCRRFSIPERMGITSIGG